MSAVASTGIILAFVKYVFVDNKPADVLMASLSIIDGESTVYADGYDESRFRSLRVGMTCRQVEDLMGAALQKGQWYTSGGVAGQGLLEEVWNYTRPDRVPGDYWQRAVYFQDGQVYRIEAGFYAD